MDWAQSSGEGLKTIFVENGLMREGEPQRIVALFRDLGVHVQLVDARKEFLDALKGIKDPEEKREAITQTFYKKVFGRLIRETGAKHLLQGTILTDVDETVAALNASTTYLSSSASIPKRPSATRFWAACAVAQRRSAQGCRSPGTAKSVYQRMPFPGPALSARVIGEVTAEKLIWSAKQPPLQRNSLLPPEPSNTWQFFTRIVCRNARWET